MSTFTITVAGVPTIATFRSSIRGSRQEVGDLQNFRVGVVLDSSADWLVMQSLVTTKYHVHSPLAGTCVIDVVRGAGEGYVVIDGLGESNALLVALERSTYLPHDRAIGTAEFLITGVAI